MEAEITLESNNDSITVYNPSRRVYVYVYVDVDGHFKISCNKGGPDDFQIDYAGDKLVGFKQYL